jgi:branched-chain amino acid transport system substrate-binding protein
MTSRFAHLTLAMALTAAVAGVAHAQDTIKIGAPLPITGPLSPEATKLQNGMNLWVETANKAGGIEVGGKRMKVEIVPVDYQSNTSRAVQTAEKLITED